jgi:hypothetical protein
VYKKIEENKPDFPGKLFSAGAREVIQSLLVKDRMQRLSE